MGDNRVCQRLNDSIDNRWLPSDNRLSVAGLTLLERLTRKRWGSAQRTRREFLSDGGVIFAIQAAALG